MNGRTVFFVLTFLPFVVIGNDQIDAALLGNLHLIDRGNAAVYGDDDFRAAVDDFREDCGVQAVPFVDAVGDVPVDLAAEDSDGVPEDGGGGDAVDVVIAVNDDFFFGVNRAGDALGRLAQVGDAIGIVQTLEARL